MSYKDILKTIEEVDPSDSEKLGEIDARVFLYLGGEVAEKILNDHDGDALKAAKRVCFYRQAQLYSTSRDALKAIRPEGWQFGIEQWDTRGWRCSMVKSGNGKRINVPIYPHDAPDNFEYGFMPTEELAELHAIIQSIAYERGEHEIKG